MALEIKITEHQWNLTYPIHNDLKTSPKEDETSKPNVQNGSLITNCTIVTATVNHHELVDKLILSLKKSIEKLPPIIVLNNGKSLHEPKDAEAAYAIMEVDNRRSKLAKPTEDQNSHRHCASIDYALKNLVRTKYAVVCDNDILFKPEVKNIFMSVPNYDALGQVCNDTRGHVRLEPYFCVLNLEKMKMDGISYYDGKRCWPKLDTGGSFLADIRNRKWSIRETGISKYIVHLSGAELYNRDIGKWLNQHKSLWD